MSKIEERLQELGLSLPTPPGKAGSYAPAKKFGGNLYFISGCGPSIGEPITGCLGVNVTAEQGYEYAKNSMLNVLAVLKREIGDLDKVKNVVKVTCFVASAPDFYAQPQVANGGTELLIQLFGEEVGTPSRCRGRQRPAPEYACGNRGPLRSGGRLISTQQGFFQKARKPENRSAPAESGVLLHPKNALAGSSSRGVLLFERRFGCSR